VTTWRTSEARVAQAMRNEGAVVSKIAARLGRTDWSVYSFLTYYTPRKTKEEALASRCKRCGAKPNMPCVGSRGSILTMLHAERRRK
jgi:hypothetical protein